MVSFLRVEFTLQKEDILRTTRQMILVFVLAVGAFGLIGCDIEAIDDATVVSG